MGKSVKKVKLILSDKELKGKLFKTFRSKKPNNLFLSEFLSRHNADLAAKLREKKRAGIIYSVFSFHGTVYYKTTAESPSVSVRCHEDVEKLGSL